MTELLRVLVLMNLTQHCALFKINIVLATSNKANATVTNLKAIISNAFFSFQRQKDTDSMAKKSRLNTL